MRWERLFDELAASLDDDAKLEHDALAEDLAAEEWAATSWTDLLGGTPTLDLEGVGPLTGEVTMIGRDLAHVLAPGPVLVHLAAVRGLRGGTRAGAPAVSRRSWAMTWRALAGEEVRLVRRDGTEVTGPVGVAGADYVTVGAVIVPTDRVSAVWARR